MIWGESIYTNSPNIEELLSSEEINLKELLDDEDILQECKSQNVKLVQYLTRPSVREELVDLITLEPSEDIPESIRYKYANIASEILTSDIPSLYDSLVSDEKTLMKLYEFIKHDPPLNPLLTAFFSKTFSTLISRKSSQNLFSYKSVCHQVLEFIKGRDDFFDMLLKHICMPVIMDLLYHIMTQIDESDMKKNFLEYINEKCLIENLIKILSQSNETEKHNNIAQFLSEIIKTGRTIRQDESQGTATEATYPILETLECENTTKLILDTILNDNQSESSITAGIKIILSLFENPIINEPVSDAALQYLIDTEKQHHKIVVTNLINCIIPTIKKFHEILLNPPEKSNKFDVTWITPPFGNTRLQVCCLFTVLIETENLDVLNVICEVDFFNTLLKLFKEYCWNNFLHNQVKKCLVYAFQAFDQLPNETILTPSALQNHIIDKCKIVSKLLDCWTHNEIMQSQERGRRLGYMGHLIEIMDHLVSNVTISEELRALVELSLNEEELALWKKLTDSENGDLVKALQVQNRYLANCNPNKQDTFDASPSKDYLNTFPPTDFHDLDPNMHDTVRLANLTLQDLEQQQEFFEQTCKETLSSFAISRDVWDDDDSDNANLKMLANNLKGSLSGNVWNDNYDPIGITIGGDDPWNTWSNDIEATSGTNTHSFNDDNWANFDANNFADFDTHFTDFDPIQTSNILMPSSNNNVNSNKNTNINKNLNNNNDIDSTLSSLIVGDNTVSQIKVGSGEQPINCDDKNLKMQKIKNLVPGADGRLVLATTFIPYPNDNNNETMHSKYITAAVVEDLTAQAAQEAALILAKQQETEQTSDDNHAIINQPNHNAISETVSDDHRNTNETIDNKNVLLENADQSAETANGEIILNGPNTTTPIEDSSIESIGATKKLETENDSTPILPSPPILSEASSTPSSQN